MATRAHIAFYETTKQPLDRPNVLLYRHSDGYPDTEYGVLAELVPFLRRFDRERGLDDIEYAAARLLHHMIKQNAPEGTLGYGISDTLHGDIEYLYAVFADHKAVVTFKREFTSDTAEGPCSVFWRDQDGRRQWARCQAIAGMAFRFSGIGGVAILSKDGG